MAKVEDTKGWGEVELIFGKPKKKEEKIINSGIDIGLRHSIGLTVKVEDGKIVEAHEYKGEDDAKNLLDV